MKKLLMCSAIALGVLGALASNSKSYARPATKHGKLNITAYRVSNCTTTASVDCSEGPQSCQFNFGSGNEDVKLKTTGGSCTVSLAIN
jgi:hypothetical protein